MNSLTQAKRNVQRQIYNYQSGKQLDPVNAEIVRTLISRKSRNQRKQNRQQAIQNYYERENPGCFYRVVRGVKKLFCLEGGKTRSKRAQRKRRTHKRR